jgi:hypothetical protein
MLVDDPMPVINPLYYEHSQVQHKDPPVLQSGELVVPTIPLELLERFVQAIEKFQVKGKFSVVPYPAGLGSIIDGWPGADLKEIRQWLALAREKVQPMMDISPEMLTHTCTLDLQTKSMLGDSEKIWSHRQNEKTLTSYITYALELLCQAGLDAAGVTSPWDFAKEVEKDYALAILAAQRKVYKRNHTWYFLDIDDVNPIGLQSHLEIRDDTGGRVVSIVSKCGDFLWQAMETTEAGKAYASSIADHYIDHRGQKGKLVDLFNVRSPIVFHTHWQSFFSNGRYTGLKSLELVFERVARCWGDKVRWTTCSELAEKIIAM